VLLLNVPPDKRGLFQSADVQRLAEFGAKVRQTFQTNRARNAGATATSVFNNDPAFGADRSVDDNHNTAWRAAEGVTSATLELDLGGAVQFHTVMLGESLAVGQRIESFAVDVWDGSTFRQVTSGTTIGYKRLLEVSPVQTERVRVRILQSRAAPSLANFGLFGDDGGAPGIVQLFQHCDFGGWTASFGATGNVSRSQIVSAGGLDNDASSMKIASGFRATLFDGDGQSGGSIVLTSDTPCFVASNFNDVLSSMRIESVAGEGGVVFFQHDSFGGDAGQALAPGDYTLAQLQASGVQNDWASSVKIPPGRRVTMFQHDNFGGASWTLTEDTPAFTVLSPNANDQLSSVRIQ
jgi:hypothetical protein